MSSEFWDKPEEAMAEEDIKQLNQEGAISVTPKIDRSAVIQQNINNFTQELANKEEKQKISGSSAYELNEEEVGSISEAILRLEQGRAYEMLIKHNLFEGVDLHPAVIRKVQDELKGFIISRLEILLGIKKEETAQLASPIKSQFNDIELTVLKQLAFKMSGGASGEAPLTTEVRVEKPAPIVTSLKPLSPTPIKSIAKIPKNISVERSKKAKEFKPLVKPPQEMTPEELLAWNKEAEERLGKRSTSKSSTPQPTVDQLQMHYATQIAQQSPKNTLLQVLVNSNKLKLEQ